jgi:diguanylate cyclase (GGDEF)-like protein
VSNGRDEQADTPPADTPGALVAGMIGLVRDQTTADLDQRASDADQDAAGMDQVVSDRDEAGAASDQRSADRDQARADELLDHAVGGTGATAEPNVQRAGDATYAATTAARTISRLDRLAAHADRAGAAAARLGSMRERDRNAVRRDEAARRREERALEIEERIASSDAPMPVRFAELRKHAALDRARAATDRRHAATARVSASALRVRLQAHLHTAHLDDLTGTFRRETGEDALALEIDRSRRGDGRFVLAIFDIDGLGAINDRAGRAAGDLVLRAFVAILRSKLRSFDPVVRFGDDEFVCGIGGADILEVERRLAAVGRELYADTGGSFSAGLAAIRWGETVEQLTARADAALLDARAARPHGASGSASGRLHDRSDGTAPGVIRVSKEAVMLVKVGRVMDVVDGRMRVFDVAGTKVAVANAGGRLFAFDDLCTHAACSLADGSLDGTTVTCPCHGSQFDVTSGTVVRGPARLPVRTRVAQADGADLLVEA